MQYLAQRAFVTYLRSIHIQKDKEIFDVIKLPIDEFSASLGLPMTPKIRFLKQKIKSKTESKKSPLLETGNSSDENVLESPKEKLDIGEIDEEEVSKGFLLEKDTPNDEEGKTSEIGDVRYFSFLEFFMEVINSKDGRVRMLGDRNYTLLSCTSGSDSR
jgi:ATP-dependent RNA helicase DDX10/DBP4